LDECLRENPNTEQRWYLDGKQLKSRLDHRCLSYKKKEKVIGEFKEWDENTHDWLDSKGWMEVIRWLPDVVMATCDDSMYQKWKRTGKYISSEFSKSSLGEISFIHGPE